jgi:hypothetical protein
MSENKQAVEMRGCIGCARMFNLLAVHETVEAHIPNQFDGKGSMAKL